MKRLYGILVALLLVAVMATPASAQGPRNGDRFCLGGATTVESNETPNSVVLFGCGARIASGARVNQDVVSFGGNVVIEKDVRVNNDVVSFGGNVVIEKDVRVSGDVVVFGGNLDLAGQVNRDVVVFGGRVTLEPTSVVQRDAVVVGGYTDKKEGAIVRGKLASGESFDSGRFRVLPLEPAILPAALGGGVLGGLTGLAFGIVRNIFYALALAALGALTVVFMPVQTKQVADTAQKFAMPSMGVGCLTSFVAVTLGILLMITICGIPFGVLVLLALFVAWLFGWIALGRLTGEKLMEAFKAREILPVVAVVIGILVLAFVGMVPIIGWVIGLFIGLLGLGAVVLTRFGTRDYPAMTPAPVAAAPSIPASTNEPTPPTTPSSSN